MHYTQRGDKTVCIRHQPSNPEIRQTQPQCIDARKNIDAYENSNTRQISELATTASTDESTKLHASLHSGTFPNPGEMSRTKIDPPNCRVHETRLRDLLETSAVLVYMLDTESAWHRNRPPSRTTDRPESQITRNPYWQTSTVSCLASSKACRKLSRSLTELQRTLPRTADRGGPRSTKA